MTMTTALGYVGISSPSFRDWGSFGPEVLGLEVVAEDSDRILLTNDDQRHRLVIQSGEVNRLAFLGWDVGTEGAIEQICEHLSRSGVPYEEGDDALKDKRQVLRVVKVRDGIGIDHEIFYGAAIQPRAFRPGRALSGFVTADQGMGHAVLVTPDREVSDRFFQKVLRMHKSDEIRTSLDLVFYHCNPRHHTAALAVVPGMRGLHHIMLEVRELDDVGIAYDLCQQRELSISMTLGRHTNDRMLSFYVRTPSGFDVEYGWGGLAVDPSWKVASYNRASIWGHQPTDNGLPGTIEAIQ